MDLQFTTSNATDLDRMRSQANTAAELVALQQARVVALKAKGVPTKKAEALLADTVHTMNLFRRRLAAVEAAELLITDGQAADAAPRPALAGTD